MKCAENKDDFLFGSCSHHPERVFVRLNNTDEPLLTLHDISMYRQGKEILHNVNLTIHRGDFVAITGPNGGGKTTLLRIILGLLKPTSGSVEWAAESTAVQSIGYLPQKNAVDSHFPISVYEVVASGISPLVPRPSSLDPRLPSPAPLDSRPSSLDPRLPSPDPLDSRPSSLDPRLPSPDPVASALEQVEMTDYARRPIGRLSGGQLQRVLLARAIVSNPQLLILDEPLSYVDKHFEAHIYRLLAQYAPHCTILLVSHEMTTIAAMANRHLIIDREITECKAAHHYAVPVCD